MATEKRLIDANEALEKIKELPDLHYFAEWYVDYDCVCNVLKNAPTVDAVEVVHSLWVDANGIRKSKCYNCGVEFGRVMGDDCKYCPTCGAKMDGDGNG